MDFNESVLEPHRDEPDPEPPAHAQIILHSFQESMAAAVWNGDVNTISNRLAGNCLMKQ